VIATMEPETGKKPKAPPKPAIADAGVSPIPEDTRHIDDPLISLSEFARRVNKDPSTVSRWARDGLFAVVRAPSGLPSVRTSVANTFLGGTAIKGRV
jgi:hypothetical protein